MAKKSNKGLFAIRLTVGIVTVVLSLWASVIYSWSFMPLWVPVVAGVALAVITLPFGPKGLGALLKIRGRVWQIVVHAAVAVTLGALGFVSSNYYGAPESSTRDVEAVVVGKYSEKRVQHRKVGRRYIKSGEYMVYYIQLRMPDGKGKRRQVSVGEYAKIRKGQIRHVMMRDGFWGYNVMWR